LWDVISEAWQRNFSFKGLKRPSIGGRIILRWIFKKWGVGFFNLLSMPHYFGVILLTVNIHFSFICRGCRYQHHGVSHCVPFTVLDNTPM